MTAINPRKVTTDIVMSLTESEATTWIMLELGFRRSVSERFCFSVGDTGPVVELLRSTVAASTDANVDYVILDNGNQTICIRREGASIAIWCYGQDRHFCLSINQASELGNELEAAADDARDHLRKVNKKAA